MRRVHTDEQGIALITVFGLSMVLALLVTALLSYGVGSMRQARYDQDWHAALAAADGGVDDFVARINRDTDYWREADDCTECGPTLDADNEALGTTAGQPNFATVPGGSAQFHYDVDASGLASTGVIVVTATGRANGVERTVRAEMRRRSFLDYLYFTEYETLDPVAYPSAAWQTWAEANCSRHAYDSPARHSSCVEIIWALGDRVEGPFHTNDQLSVSGKPEFASSASTSRSDAHYYDWSARRLCAGHKTPSSSCTSAPDFAEGLKFREPLTLPPSNNQIKAEADPAIGGEGCMYVGATFLRFASNGSITVKSRATDDPSTSKCPINGTMSAPPGNGVIYVRAAKPSESCLSSAPHPYNLSNDVTAYDRCAGDVFVEGTLDGRVTVAAENNIIISNSIVYKGGRSSSSDDMLGLIANNFVEIMHPVTSSGNDIKYLSNKRFESPRIDAAILSVEHSFRVQNHDEGKPFSGDIDLHGTLGQLYRGPVGTFSGGKQQSGYEKDYKYDERLEFVSPPHFLDAVQAAWSVRTWSEE